MKDYKNITHLSKRTKKYFFIREWEAINGINRQASKNLRNAMLPLKKAKY